MSQIKDISPSLNIPSAENEFKGKENFQETPLQTVGGLQAGSREMVHGKIRIAGIDERIYFGDAVDVMDGVGIFMGKVDEEYYDFRFGDPEGNYVRWAEEPGNLEIFGTIHAGTGSEVDWSYIDNIRVKNIHIDEVLSVGNTEADKTQDELDAGASIDDAKAAGSTLIEGGYINTSILDIDYALIVGDKPPSDADHTADQFSEALSDIDTGSDKANNGLSDSYRITKGFVESDLSHETAPYNGVRIDSNGIYGYDSGNSTFYINNSGDAYFAGTLGADIVSADNIAGQELKGVDIISTDGGDDRIELSSGDELKFYAGGSLRGTLRGTAVGTGVALDDGDLALDNNKSVLINSSGTGNSYGSISITSQDEFWVTTGTDNTFFIKNHDQSQNLATVNSYGDLFARGDFLIQDDNNMKIDGQSTHLRFLNDGLRTNQNYVPFSDDSTRLGSSNVRWSDVYAVEVHTGDIDFDNDWVLTESYNMDIEEDGMALVDESGELKYFFGKDKFYTPENVNALKYTRLAKEKKIKKQKDEELT